MRPVLAIVLVLATAFAPSAQARVETGLALGLRYDADISGSATLTVRLGGGGPMGVIGVLYPTALELAAAWRFIFPDPDPEAVWLPWFATGLVVHTPLGRGPTQIGPAVWFGMAYRLTEVVSMEATFDVWVRPFPLRGEYRLALGPVITW